MAEIWYRAGTVAPYFCFNSSDMMLLQRVTSKQLIDLHIWDLERVIDLKEVENLELRTKRELCSLTLKWTSTGVCAKTKKHNKAVLEKLQPHNGLEILRMENYAGDDMPDWTPLLPKLVKLELHGVQLKRLHLDQFQYESVVSLQREIQTCHFESGLEVLHLSHIESLQTNQPVCIECSQPLRKLQRIVMSGINNQELKISMQGGEGDEDLFPGLQHLEMVVCENLRFQPSIPRSAKYIISGIIEFD
uniref:R13L1/DRL21-like LRR repeat region domain-containing protein n=1 Tax=Oryza meridionalis TaxID=40149 RepID=A0A0E0E4A4_9ORYZ